MRQALLGTALGALIAATAAQAQVTGVVTRSDATVTLTNGTTIFSGDNISGSLNGPDLSGVSYDSTSSVDGPEIVFKNGSTSAGNFASASSFTSVDISFTNDTGAALTPKFSSTILPAGLGLLVTDGCGAGPVRLCGETADRGISFLDLPFVPSQGSFNALIAKSTFDFNIYSGDFTVYSLTGSVSLVYDFRSERNILITELEDAAAALTGFTQVIYPGSPTGLAFAWDSTLIEFDLPSELAAGASTTLRYDTQVTTFTRSPRFGCYSALAFGAFGDPVGRGGSIPPPADFARQAVGPDDGCGGALRGPPPEARTFRFATPTFNGGVLSLRQLPPFGGTVPEPATWATMLGGFGLAGAALRRRRRLDRHGSEMC